MPYVPGAMTLSPSGGATGGPYLPPGIDAQRNSITAALMNIARPPPSPQMPLAQQIGRLGPAMPQSPMLPTPGAPPQGLPSPLTGAVPSPLPGGAPPTLPGVPPPTVPQSFGMPPQPPPGAPPTAPQPPTVPLQGT